MSPISSISMPLPPDAAMERTAEDRKIAESCRQFEGIIWRQMLEKSFQPLLSSSDGKADKTGTYGYLVGDTLANAVSGGPNSFAALLQDQLMPRTPAESP